MKHFQATVLALVFVLTATVAFTDDVQDADLNTFSSGDPALASEVNENFDVLQDAINDNDSRIDILEADSDADTLDGLDSTDFLQGSGDFTYDSGTLSVGSGATLQVDGTLSASELTYTSARTHSVIVTGFAFHPFSSSATFEYNWSSIGAYCTSGSDYLVAPVYLPDNATITAVSFRVYDAYASGDITMSFREVSQSGYYATIAEETSSGSSGWQYLNATSLSHAVHVSYPGFVIIAMPTGSWSGSTLIAFGTRIWYTIDEAQ